MLELKKDLLRGLEIVYAERFDEVVEIVFGGGGKASAKRRAVGGKKKKKKKKKAARAVGKRVRKRS